MGLYAISGAVVAALVGSFVSGVALAAGWLHMPWARAFALGVYGGAAIGLLLGAAIGALRALASAPIERSEPIIRIKKRGSSPRRAPVARYRSA